MRQAPQSVLPKATGHSKSARRAGRQTTAASTGLSSSQRSPPRMASFARTFRIALAQCHPSDGKSGIVAARSAARRGKTLAHPLERCSAQFLLPGCSVSPNPKFPTRSTPVPRTSSSPKSAPASDRSFVSLDVKPYPPVSRSHVHLFRRLARSHSPYTPISQRSDPDTSAFWKPPENTGTSTKPLSATTNPRNQKQPSFACVYLIGLDRPFERLIPKGFAPVARFRANLSPRQAQRNFGEMSVTFSSQREPGHERQRCH